LIIYRKVNTAILKGNIPVLSCLETNPPFEEDIVFLFSSRILIVNCRREKNENCDKDCIFTDRALSANRQGTGLGDEITSQTKLHPPKITSAKHKKEKEGAEKKTTLNEIPYMQHNNIQRHR